MLLPVVTFATLQIKTILLVKPWDRAGHAFNSELLGVLMHMRPLFMVMFPIEPVILPEHLFCFVFVRDFGKNVFPPQMSHAKDPLMMPGPTQPLPDA